MAITDANSVLILGAGASVPFGFPLGGKLIDLIRELALAEVDDCKRENEAKEKTIRADHTYIHPRIGLGSGRFMLKVLCKDTWGSDDLLAFEEIEKLKNVASLLNGQTSETIDDFIAINPAVSDIMKIGIAAVFFNHLYSRSKSGWDLNALSTRQVAGERRNWVHHLINLVRHHNFEKTDEERSKVRIISFNYDGIVETILNEQFNNTEHAFGK